jgi:tRNA-dihydrouridine synthase 3
VDLNCGCPIHQITRHGLGASLMRKPRRLARLVGAMARAVTIPVTVKLRTGWSAEKPTVAEAAKACEEAGAAAITIHGRSREQRYQRAADWDLIGKVASERGIPVVGNGDVLTHYEARERMQRSGVRSLMLARGALIKPWLFRELKDARSWLPSAEERLQLLWRFAGHLREHFGEGEEGRRRIAHFLPWHLGFFARYRPLPEAQFAAAALEHPLIHVRHPLGDGLPPLEALLRDPREDTHARFADVLLDAGGFDELGDRALGLARELGPPSDAPAELEPAVSEVAG